MVKTKTLTQADLIKTLKKIGIATKDDVKVIVKDATKSFATKDDVKVIVKDATKSFATKDDVKVIVKDENVKQERRLVRRMGKMERSLRQSITNLAETTPTRTEFETLRNYRTPLS